MNWKRSLIWVGSVGQLFAYLAALTNWTFVQEWFYFLVWWSYILLIDGIIYRRTGNSLIVSRTKSFLLMLPWSVLIWLVFELANLRLQNWYYVEVTPIAVVRWFGYALAFATVLPGLFETYELLTLWRLFPDRAPASRISNQKTLLSLGAAGVACLILPVALPKFFFPIIWLGFLLLLEPINFRLGGGLFLKTGCWEKVLRLFTAGLVCGILWEFWNWLSISHWVYNLPYASFGKIFEMPLLGYPGFLPFAAGCYLMYEFIILTGYAPEWQPEVTLPEPPAKVTPRLALAAYGLLAVFSGAMFYLLDNITVHGFKD